MKCFDVVHAERGRTEITVQDPQHSFSMKAILIFRKVLELCSAFEEHCATTQEARKDYSTRRMVGGRKWCLSLLRNPLRQGLPGKLTTTTTKDLLRTSRDRPTEKAPCQHSTRTRVKGQGGVPKKYLTTKLVAPLKHVGKRLKEISHRNKLQ